MYSAVTDKNNNNNDNNNNNNNNNNNRFYIAPIYISVLSAL